MRFPSEKTTRILIAFVALVGLAVATYILISDATAGAPSCLVGGAGCETVAKSHYSHILGINVAAFGVAAWILVIATTLRSDDLARLGGFLVSLGGVGFSVYLTYLEIWQIKAICPWCVSNASLMALCFLLSAVRLIGYVGRRLDTDTVELTDQQGKTSR